MYLNSAGDRCLRHVVRESSAIQASFPEPFRFNLIIDLFGLHWVSAVNVLKR